MASHQLYPLQVNPQTGEPFLRLKSHENIIITPPRLTDAPFLPPILNDPLVCKWLTAPPHPYLPEHAESWLTTITTASDAVLHELEEAKDTPSLKVVKDCPVRFLREVQENGTDIFLGDVAFIRCPWMDLVRTGSINWEQREILTEKNAQLECGDPKIVWSAGDYLVSSHHGRGIMSAAFATLLREWAIPRMGVRHMLVTTLKGNQGSVRVFEKAGFTLRETLKDYIEANGKTHEVHVLEWELEE